MRTPTLVDVLLAEMEGDPGALDVLADRLAPLIAARQRSEPGTDGWLDMRAAAEYLSITPIALRKHTAARTIPFEQDGPGAKCFFKRSELDAWRRGERFHGSSQPIANASKTLPNGPPRTLRSRSH